jgi:hypothetical protein
VLSEGEKVYRTGSFAGNASTSISNVLLISDSTSFVSLDSVIVAKIRTTVYGHVAPFDNLLTYLVTYLLIYLLT